MRFARRDSAALMRALRLKESCHRNEPQHPRPPDAFSRTGLTINIDALEQLESMVEVKTRSFRIKRSGSRFAGILDWNRVQPRPSRPGVLLRWNAIKFGVEEKKVLATYKKAAQSGFLLSGSIQHLGSGWVKEDFEIVKAPWIRWSNGLQCRTAGIPA